MRYGGSPADTITANFTIFFASSARGSYAAHTAQIVDWPRGWDYGAFGNWNPAPLVHPNGSVYLMAHTSSRGYKQGKAIIAADTWRGPYRLAAAIVGY